LFLRGFAPFSFVFLCLPSTRASHKKHDFPRLTGVECTDGEVIRLPGVYMGDNDTFDYSLRKFKKQVEKAGILSELKKRQHFEKPSIQKKKKEAAAKKRLLKKIRKMQVM
jgi:small subunit ribosomal protein S21